MLSSFLEKCTASTFDRVISEFDHALHVLATRPTSQRKMPKPVAPAANMLSQEEKNEVVAMMRVNHVGEVCAQALYRGQGFATLDPARQAFFKGAAQEENDHLAWTESRLRELDARPSLLNPLWYGGSLILGLIAGRLGDKASLGFMAETEKQVELHLTKHLDKLPAQDLQSRAILEQMKLDEMEHGHAALQQGGVRPSLPIRLAMTGMSKIMTTLSRKI